jgi:hypothetical protein
MINVDSDCTTYRRMLQSQAALSGLTVYAMRAVISLFSD